MSLASNECPTPVNIYECLKLSEDFYLQNITQLRSVEEELMKEKQNFDQMKHQVNQMEEEINKLKEEQTKLELQNKLKITAQTHVERQVGSLEDEIKKNKYELVALEQTLDNEVESYIEMVHRFHDNVRLVPPVSHNDKNNHQFMSLDDDVLRCEHRVRLDLMNEVSCLEEKFVVKTKQLRDIETNISNMKIDWEQKINVAKQNRDNLQNPVNQPEIKKLELELEMLENNNEFLMAAYEATQKELESKKLNSLKSSQTFSEPQIPNQKKYKFKSSLDKVAPSTPRVFTRNVPMISPLQNKESTAEQSESELELMSTDLSECEDYPEEIGNETMEELLMEEPPMTLNYNNFSTKILKIPDTFNRVNCKDDQSTQVNNPFPKSQVLDRDSSNVSFAHENRITLNKKSTNKSTYNFHKETTYAKKTNTNYNNNEGTKEGGNNVGYWTQEGGTKYKAGHGTQEGGTKYKTGHGTQEGGTKYKPGYGTQEGGAKYKAGYGTQGGGIKLDYGNQTREDRTTYNYDTRTKEGCFRNSYKSNDEIKSNFNQSVGSSTIGKLSKSKNNPQSGTNKAYKFKFRKSTVLHIVPNSTATKTANNISKTSQFKFKNFNKEN